MSIALKPAHQQFIQQQIALEQFDSEEAVLEKVLQLLSSQYLEYDAWVEDTRAEIDEAQLTEKCTRLIDFPNMGKRYEWIH
jgi:antitoxin ParD1/3/4